MLLSYLLARCQEFFSPGAKRRGLLPGTGDRVPGRLRPVSRSVTACSAQASGERGQQRVPGVPPAQPAGRLDQAGIITGFRAVVDPRRVGLSIHAVVRLRTTHARITAALDHFATVPEIISLYRLTGEDCFLIDIHAASAERLEALVDSIARFGPVTTSLVLRSYPPKPVTPAPPGCSAGVI